MEGLISEGAYKWRGLCQRRVITGIEKALQNKLNGIADQNMFCIYWLVIKCQCIIMI